MVFLDDLAEGSAGRGPIQHLHFEREVGFGKGLGQVGHDLDREGAPPGMERSGSENFLAVPVTREPKAHTHAILFRPMNQADIKPYLDYAIAPGPLKVQEMKVFI